jgi:hypothetical protein
MAEEIESVRIVWDVDRAFRFNYVESEDGTVGEFTVPSICYPIIAEINGVSMLCAHGGHGRRFTKKSFDKVWDKLKGGREK